jgi:hypothetical protein
MEYFGNKYPDYMPTLPSKIIEVLRSVSSERQMPSRGLNVGQISFALREFGFGTRLYSQKEFGDEEFRRLFSCYVESGIPLIVAVQNSKIGHAILCVGHNIVTTDLIDSLTESKNGTANVVPSKVHFFDNDDTSKDFVFIDDNMPVYQQLPFEKPTGGYTNPDWNLCVITSFIAPLYPKIYLEAFEAKRFCRNILFGFYSILDDSEVYLRFFLSSSRSFKDSLNYNGSFDGTVKRMILETPLPKFVWIGEISTKDLIKNKEANGLILIDATEADTSQLKPLIFANYLNIQISLDSGGTFFTKKDVPLPTFSIFTNNLK